MIRFTSLVLALVLTGVQAQANLVDGFASINSEGGKGPFGQNILQGSTGRVGVLQGHPSGGLQFQAAYRNEAARVLAVQYDFYVANLFTTNYYELMGEYVYNDQYGSHALDHAALVRNASAALPKANSMIKHWVLEKHFVATNPGSKLARSFLLRGVSDLQNERTYATHFFNFYLTAISDEYQFIPAYVLAKGSPITDSASLERARVDISTLYDSIKARSGDRSAVALAAYRLRNAIHNQLSILVIRQIDEFMANYPGVGTQTLSSIKTIIQAYYNVTAQKVADLARAAGATELASAASAVVRSGPNAETLLLLAQEAAALRAKILDIDSVPYAKKTPSLVALFSASQFVNKEINKMEAIPSATANFVMAAIVNTLYVEGYLTRDHLGYFVPEAVKVTTAAAAGTLTADMSDIAAVNIQQAFLPALSQWEQIQPGLSQAFLDNLVKSSALNTASTIISKIR